MPERAERKRGAQPGNRNAIASGFYAKARLSALRTELLPEARADGSLQDDIDLLRVEVATLVRSGHYDYKDLAALSRAITAAVLAEHRITGGDDRNAMMDALNAVLADVRAIGGPSDAGEPASGSG